MGEFPLAGPQGPTGPQGSTISYGNGEPLYTPLRAGDFYINSSTGYWYNSSETNDSFVWNKVFTVKGERGERGLQGYQGIQGPIGPTGATGAIGPQGIQGIRGPQGPAFNIQGTLTSSSLLPTPTEEMQDEGYAYLIPDTDGNKHVWVIQGSTGGPFSWVDIGFSGIQGPQGPAGADGAGVNSTSDVKLDIGDTTVSYNTTDGIVIESTMRVTYNNNETHDCPVRYSIPIKGINGMAFDKADGTEQIEAGLSEDSAISVSAINVESSFFTNKKLSITPIGFNQKKTDGSTIYYLPTISGSSANIALENNLPTLFGNKSLTAGGNIDIYQHNIKILMRDSSTNTLGTIYLLVYSSNNLIVDSLTDLKTLLGDTFTIQASGYYKDKVTSPTMWGSVFRVTQTGIGYISSQSSATQTVSYSNPAFSDTVTAI